MGNIEEAQEKIKAKINEDVDWTYPYWLDASKKEFADIPEGLLEDMYFKEMKAKIGSMSHDELRSVLEEQNALTSANQNFYVINCIEEILSDDKSACP